MSDAAGTPVLSVVVTVVEGEPALTRCLSALAAQEGAPGLDVIVPFDGPLPQAAALRQRFPAARFVDTGHPLPAGSRNAYDEHALYERRRAAGLRAATGTLAALLEDRGWPRPDWARTMIELHARSNAAGIGGVVEHGGRGPLRWALFFADFGRYQPGVREGRAEYLSDVNICYKREPLERVRHLWQESYQESTVNWALAREGHDLLLSSRPVVVEERAVARLGPTVLERMHWARIFAHVRGREAASRWACLAWAAATPLLPLVLFTRHLRRQLAIGRHLAAFAGAAPATLLVLACWAAGEFVGYCEAAWRWRPRATPAGR